MKVLLLLLISTQAFADYPMGALPKSYKPAIGECIISYNLDCYVNQKISKNTYGMVCDTPMVENHAVVKLDYTLTFPQYGRFTATIKRTKTGRAKLSNGFDVAVDYFEACDPKTIKGFPGGTNG